MIRVLHFADLHLGTENYGRLDPNTGLSSRLSDFLTAFDYVIDHALSNEIDLVLFAGDAFKNRDPSPTHQREFAKRILRLSAAHIPTVLLVGNHDLPNASKRAHAVEIFGTLQIPHVTIGDRVRTHRITTKQGVVQVITVPWLTRSHLLARDDSAALTRQEAVEHLEGVLSKEMARQIEALNQEEPAILLGHGTVPSAKMGSERDIMLGQDVTLDITLLRNPKLDYVALGHIHRHQSLNTQPPIVYSGSIERIDFGERDEVKGFVVAEIEKGNTRWQFLPTPTRTFREVTLDVRDQSDPMPYLRNEFTRMNFTDAIVKIIILATEENEAQVDVREIRYLLKDANYIAGVVRDVKRQARLRLGSAQEIANATPRDLLARYLESKQFSATRQAHLLRCADEIFKDDG